MSQGTSPAVSFPYLLLFSGLYFTLVLISLVIGPALPWLASIQGFISLMILILPAWVAARRFLRVEGRAPTTQEAAKLAIVSFLVALIVELFVISCLMRLQGTFLTDQLSSLQKSLTATIASQDFGLFAGVMLGLSALKVISLGIIYRNPTQPGANST